MDDRNFIEKVLSTIWAVSLIIFMGGFLLSLVFYRSEHLIGVLRAISLVMVALIIVVSIIASVVILAKNSKEN